MIIIIVIVLYLIANAGLSPSNRKTLPKAGPVPVSEVPSAEPKPMFRASFINEHVPGTISHVSSIAPAGKDKMIAAWYSGSREGARDVAIYHSFYNVITKEWSSPEVLINREQASTELGRYIKKLGNPVVISGPKGRLWLFYSSVTLGGWSGSTINYKISKDQGKTWSKSRKIILSPFLNLTNNVKNGHISLSESSFILPVYHEFIHKYSQVLLVSNIDEEPYYEISRMTRSMKAIQPSILKGSGERLKAFFRNMGTGPDRPILRSDSDALGLRWSDISATSLPNPNSGFSMTVSADGSFVGIINYSSQDRSDLSIVISHDEGDNWKRIAILENSKGQEYSYPFIVKDRNGRYHVTYTYERKKIRHVVFNEKWLMAKAGGID